MLAGFSFLLFLAYFAWMLVAQHGGEQARLLSQVSPLAAGLFAGAACIHWSQQGQRRKMDPKTQSAWLSIGIGSGLFAAGQLLRFYFEKVRQVPAPWPGPLDLGYFVPYFFFLYGCFRLHHSNVPQTRSHRVWEALVSPLISPWANLRSTDYAKRVMDVLMVMVSLTALCWVYLVSPILGSSGGGIAKIIGVAYPVLGLALMGGLIVLTIQQTAKGLETRSLWLLVSGLVCAVVANVLFSASLLHTLNGTGSLVAQGPFRSGGAIDLFWTAAFGLFGYAALWSCWGGPVPLVRKALDELNETVRWEERARFVLPYIVAVGACVLLIVGDFNIDKSVGFASLFFVGTIFVLLVRRQVVLSYENLDVARNLEDLVSERTEELRTQADFIAAQNSQLGNQAQTLLQHQVELERRGSRLSALHTVTVAANTSLDTKIILREALRALVSVIPNSWAGAYMLNESGSAELAVTWADHVAPRLRPPDRLPDVPSGMACSLPRSEVSTVLVPLASRSNLLALLQIGILEGELTEHDLTLLEAMGTLIGGALENARLYQEAKDRADRDPVTSLFNHRALQERLEQEISRARRDETSLAVVVMDLNNFKLFNDTYGHPVGDQVLRTVGKALKEVCRTTDIFGRHGGDEFLAILPGCSADQAINIADRVNDYLARNGYRFAGEDRVIPVGVSAGIAVYPQDANLRDSLLAYADENMYESKRQGGRAVAATEDVRKLRQLREGESFGVLDGMVWAVNNKDSYTRRHSDEVTRYSVWMAEHLGWNEGDIQTMRMSSLLHDVGKIGVPDSVLRKPQRLTEEEEAIMRQHPVLGAMLVAAVPEMADIIPGVRHHHERWDGNGYPDGLKGEQIPIMGRVMAVADAFSAMTTDRPYRKALPLEIAIEQLLKGAGTQFDVRIVNAFIAAVVPKLKETPQLQREEVMALS